VITIQIRKWRIVTVKIPEEIAGEVDKIIASEGYGTVSEAIREALRLWIQQKKGLKSIVEGEGHEERK